jgi:3-oxoacyl-[acyl-carrier protein] reductase
MQRRSADEIADRIRSSGGRAVAWEGDLADPATISGMFDQAEAQLGPVDILVNNAAHYQADTFLPQEGQGASDEALWEGGPVTTAVTPESHDLAFAVNTRAVALSMRVFAERRVRDGRRWGRIVNVSADCSWGCPAEVSYRASKYALESYSRAAAAELGPLGVTVNILSPGPIQTGYISPALEEQLVTEIPLRRVGTPEDVADAIVFLSSDQARWITGQLLTVHGGHRMVQGR